MALRSPLGFWIPVPVPREEAASMSTIFLPVWNLATRCHRSLRFSPATGRKRTAPAPGFPKLVARASRAVDSGGDDYSGKEGSKTREPGGARDTAAAAADDDDDVFLMEDGEREEWRRKIRAVVEATPDVEEEADPEERRRKMQKLLAEYPLVVEEDDPDWPEDADGWGFNFDQFFNKITIKNVKKEDGDDESYDGDKEEIAWQDDDYIRPIRDVTAREWEDTVFRDFNPLVILVLNRYNRPRENEMARNQLEKAVQMFWESGLPSPRCVAIDAVVEQDLVSTLKVSTFPEILFTKAGKILHRDKVVRTADEWSKIMAFFYYKAVRPSFLDKTVGQNQEKIPSL